MDPIIMRSQIESIVYASLLTTKQEFQKRVGNSVPCLHCLEDFAHKSNISFSNFSRFGILAVPVPILF